MRVRQPPRQPTRGSPSRWQLRKWGGAWAPIPVLRLSVASRRDGTAVRGDPGATRPSAVCFASPGPTLVRAVGLGPRPALGLGVVRGLRREEPQVRRSNQDREDQGAARRGVRAERQRLPDEERRPHRRPLRRQAARRPAPRERKKDIRGPARPPRGGREGFSPRRRKRPTPSRAGTRTAASSTRRESRSSGRSSSSSARARSSTAGSGGS